MRVGPDLSSFGSELPDLEELLPEEVQYLLAVCRMLNELGLHARAAPAHDDAHFDADELGLDPEDD